MLQEHVGRKVIIHNCIIHQQVLCKVLEFDLVMLVVVSIANYLQTSKLKRGLFKSFLKAGAEYGDIVYHTDVRWLGHRKVLKRALKDERTNFFKAQPQTYSKLEDSCWNED